MRSRFVRSATRSGWRGVALLGLLPMSLAAFFIALCAHGVVQSVAGDAYCVVAGLILLLAFQISFGRRNG